MTSTKRPFGQRYAFVVVAVIFLCLLISASVRAAPGVLLNPLRQAFGWDRDSISLAAAIGILLYGLAGPFAAALMERLGLRRTVIGALAVIAAATAASLFMTAPWHLMVTWGLFSGVGTGAVAAVLGATIVNRWFTTNRGLMMGLMSASTATGTLIFLPAMAALAESGGWKTVVIAIAIASAVLIPVVFFLVPERPSAIGLVRYGANAMSAQFHPEFNADVMRAYIRRKHHDMHREGFDPHHTFRQVAPTPLARRLFRQFSRHHGLAAV